MPATILEICIDSSHGLKAAAAGGADRVELCSALSLGGLTPGPGLMKQAAHSNLPCHAMIRPRPGDFVLREGDLDAMLGDISAARDAGLDGVVIGAARSDGALDTEALAELKEASQGLHVTLHRVFDLTPDPMKALNVAIDLGIHRILTSGQARTAALGIATLARLVDHAKGRIQIMAGGGVTSKSAAILLDAGVDALHASASSADSQHTDCETIGITTPTITDTAKVAALRSAIMSKAACA